MHGTHALVLAVTLASSSASSANDITCPAGTIANGETTPEVREAWCELMWHGTTVMHGPYRAWWPDGTLGNAGQYIHGKPEGKWRAWYPSGQLQGEEWFQDGHKLKSRYFDENGREIDEPET